MVDILKIKDENGDWVTVQAFQGQTGLTPHIQIGQVTVGATPSDAAASISGIKEFPLLNLTLPRGNTGEPGIAVASAEPQTDQLVWIDTGTPANTKVIPEVDDATVNYVDTWSSAKIRDFIYPIGSIYLSVNSISPAAIFGGTWEQIQDTFLLAAGSTYTAGSTGGEVTHTLIEAEIPAHTHERGTMNITGGFAPWSDGKGTNIKEPEGAFESVTSNQYGWGTTSGRDQDNAWIDFDASKSWTGETSSYGGGGTHNNMPPYLAIYVWKRTA